MAINNEQSCEMELRIGRTAIKAAEKIKIVTNFDKKLSSSVATTEYNCIFSYESNFQSFSWWHFHLRGQWLRLCNRIDIVHWSRLKHVSFCLHTFPSCNYRLPRTRFFFTMIHALKRRSIDVVCIFIMALNKFYDWLIGSFFKSSRPSMNK